MRWVLSAGVAIVAIVSACGDDSSSPTPTVGSTATTSPTAPPSATAAPSPSPDTNLIRWSPDLDLPANMALIIEQGCWACDGGFGPLNRVYRDSTGNVRTEQLYAGFKNSLPRVTYESSTGPQETLANVTGKATTQDASVMAASFCIKGSCTFSNGLGGSFDPSSEGVAYRSLDGGITWQEIGHGGPVFGVSGVLSDGRVLLASDAQDDGKWHYSLLPDNTPVEPPVGGVDPVTVSNEVLWKTNDGRLLLSDGTPIFTAPNGDPNPNDGGVIGSFNGPQDGEALVYWDTPTPVPHSDNSVDRFALTELEITGGQVHITRQWEIDGYLATVGWWSAKDDRAIISIVPEDATHSYSNQTPLPAIVDLSTGVFTLIPGPFKSNMPGYSSLGRTIVHAVQTGPFARVTGTGSCLNIRADASASGAVLACMADGVLLHDNGETRVTSEGMWESVTTPAGTQGWASGNYITQKATN